MTTTATRATTPEDRARYGCPDWCVRWDHSAGEADHPEGHFHYAADIGACGPQARGDEFGVYVYLGKDTAYVTEAATLRRVAADMVKAAEWLEAHQ